MTYSAPSNPPAVPRSLQPAALPAAVLWDFDGTLIDSDVAWIRAEHQLVEELGGTWNDELAHALIGKSLLDAGQSLVEATGCDLTPAEIVDRMLILVTAELAAAPIDWRPGALELLAEINRAGVPCALVSASYRGMLESVLDRLPADFFPQPPANHPFQRSEADPFQVVVAGDEVTHGKPHPGPYLKACRLLGVDPADCLVLEDSITGSDSGNAAGAVVGVVPNFVPVPSAHRRFHLETLAGVDLGQLADLMVAAR